MFRIGCRLSALLLCLALVDFAATAQEVVPSPLAKADPVAAAPQDDGIRVTDAAGLAAALASATGGATIRLAPGDYGLLELDGRSEPAFGFDHPVTITSEDPDRPAVFTGLDVREAENLRFEHLTFDYTWKAGDSRSIIPFSIRNSRNISVRGCTFDGDTAKGGDPAGIGYATGRGLSANSNVNFDFIDNTVHTFWKGVGIGISDNVRVIGNEFFALRSDGLNVNAPQGILIESNHFHDFEPAPDSSDHLDFIQFATTNAPRPGTDITIRGNLFDMGDVSSGIHSIFMRNEKVDKGLAGPEMFFRNVLIEQNMVYAANLHGISVGETSGLVIRSNTVLRNPAPSIRGDEMAMKKIPRIRAAKLSMNVTVEDNIAFDVPKVRPGWTIEGNLKAQDLSPEEPGFYAALFVPRSQGSAEGLAALTPLMIRPEGPAARPGLGSDLMR